MVTGTPDAVVIGGGIAGLAAAERLASAGRSVVLMEASHRVGGKVCTISFCSHPLDVGPEMLVTSPPCALQLIEGLGLGADLVAPAPAPAHVWVDGRLRALPTAVITGAPGGASALVRSGLLSPAGLLRAGLDLMIPSTRPAGDVSIGAIVRERLGAAALENVFEPLLGGIHAGRCDDLSAQALAPQLLTALASSKGLLRGLRAASARKPQPRQGHAFVSLRGGLGMLVAALERRLTAAGVEIDAGIAARAVHSSAGRVRVIAGDGVRVEARACVLATPAHKAARILAGAAPVAAAELDRITYAPVAVIALGYPAGSLDRLPPGTGFLAAPKDGGLVTACTWSSAKWPHLAGGTAILKASVGRAGQPPPNLPDAPLAMLVDSELSAILDLSERATSWHVQRFDDALPQYAVGHQARVARIQAALPDRVEVAGAAYTGAGIPACVASGQRAADRVIARLISDRRPSVPLQRGSS